MAKPHRTADPVDVRLGEPAFAQPLPPRRVGPAAPQRADVEAGRAQGGHQRRVVDLRVVTERHERRPPVEADPGERLLRPAGLHPDSREARRAREGPARVDEHDVEPGQLGHGSQRLRHVHGADEDEADGRGVHPEEDLAPPGLDRAGLVAQDRLARLGEEQRIPVVAGLPGAEHPRLAGGQPGGEHGGAPRSEVHEQLVQDLPPHPMRSTYTSMLPPQGRPALQACSSVTP